MTSRKCKFPGCPRKHCAKGLCKAHDAQRRNHRRLTPFEDTVKPAREPLTGPWTGDLARLMAGAPGPDPRPDLQPTERSTGRARPHSGSRPLNAGRNPKPRSES